MAQGSERKAAGSGSKAKAEATGKAAPRRASASKAKPKRKPAAKSKRGLRVAVTGPTGDIGLATLKALEGSPSVAEVVGMARRPFDPSDYGLSKVSYQQGDVLDRVAVEALVKGADVVMHLAFIIFGNPADAHRINSEGSRNVFEASVGAKVKRLVYTSSVAAYGFHADNPQPLTEDVPTRGSEGFYYSAHKAELEQTLLDALEGSDVDAYVFRPCIVAGAGATTLVTTMVNSLPVFGQLPKLRRALDSVPFIGPVIPDPGVEFQLVHADDVADALRAAVEGKGSPGYYNLAGQGATNVGRLAKALGWWSIAVPGVAVSSLDEVLSRVPGLPAEIAWLTSFRVPVLMDCRHARDQLGWEPTWDAEATLRDTVISARASGEI